MKALGLENSCLGRALIKAGYSIATLWLLLHQSHLKLLRFSGWQHLDLFRLIPYPVVMILNLTALGSQAENEAPQNAAWDEPCDQFLILVLDIIAPGRFQRFGRHTDLEEALFQQPRLSF